MSDNIRWMALAIRIEGKKYKINHTYDELKALLGVDMLCNAKDIGLDIKNIGLLNIKHFEFNGPKHEAILVCTKI